MTLIILSFAIQLNPPKTVGNELYTLEEHESSKYLM